MKSLKIMSWILGIFMFSFSSLKLIQPFNGWFHTQLITSGIGDFAFPFGVGTEIITGVILLGALLLKAKTDQKRFFAFILAGSVLVIFTMITAIYVHLQPGVPASVLPLGIKPPFIPVSVLLLAGVNGYYTIRYTAKQKPRTKGR